MLPYWGGESWLVATGTLAASWTAVVATAVAWCGAFFADRNTRSVGAATLDVTIDSADKTRADGPRGPSPIDGEATIT
ncbi:hypothetical protein DQP55_21870 [Mycolicibacterium sp. GF69]|nr:hypothetical protein DQP55_21870 [Mycolicibacterium sp. GF69]